MMNMRRPTKYEVSTLNRSIDIEESQNLHLLTKFALRMRGIT